jgi:phosphinothricin acetyltransferase
MLRNVQISDSKDICNIYNYYVLNSIITFDEEPLELKTIESMITESTADLPWLVAEINDQVIGYAYTSKWKSRYSYRYTVESSIYLHPNQTGQGFGKQLYSALISQLRSQNLHSIIGGISLPNPASIALHEKLGFEKVAHFKEVGCKFGKWIDVGYWELIFNPQVNEQGNL